jgi:hypothetical protein
VGLQLQPLPTSKFPPYPYWSPACSFFDIILQSIFLPHASSWSSTLLHPLHMSFLIHEVSHKRSFHILFHPYLWYSAPFPTNKHFSNNPYLICLFCWFHLFCYSPMLSSRMWKYSRCWF